MIQTLGFSAKRLQRLRFIEGLNPGLRVAIPDMRILKMREVQWQRHFVQNNRTRWKKGNTVRPPVLPRDAYSPLKGIDVPESGNLFAFGRSLREAREEGQLPPPQAASPGQLGR